MLKLLFYVPTAAQYYSWKNIIYKLKEHGNSSRVLLRDYGSSVNIVDKSDEIEYYIFKRNLKKILRYTSLVRNVRLISRHVKQYSPDIILGYGVSTAITGFLTKTPSIIFNDSEPIGLQNNIIAKFANVVITPTAFSKNLGNRQIRINSLKELAYLHRNYFRPDISILEELGVLPQEKYVILRFNIFDAVHDIGKHGFSQKDQFTLVDKLSKYSHVFISPEGKLPEALEKYRLPIKYDRIHHALYYAQLLVTDTQTMTTEAALLGTPVVRCNNFVGPNDMGNFVELEKKYDLIYSFNDTERALQKAVELIRIPDLKEQWVKKREALLSDKIDFTQFMVDFIENYPKSLEKHKQQYGVS